MEVADGSDQDIVEKVVTEERKEPVRLKDLGGGDEGENVKSLRNRFSNKKGRDQEKEAKEGEKKKNKGGEFEIYDSSDSD